MRINRIETSYKLNQIDPHGNKILQELRGNGYSSIQEIRTVDSYTFRHPEVQSDDQLEALARELFLDEVIFDYAANSHLADQTSFDWYVEVSFKPGVTDNAANVAIENLALRLGQAFQDKNDLRSSKAYLFKGDLNFDEVKKITETHLMNALIQKHSIISSKNWSAERGNLYKITSPATHHEIKVDRFELDDVKTLLKLSDERILALSEEEAKTIVTWFKKNERTPTDVELEVLAQTWSEHCKHKIFNALIEYEDEKGNVREINSLYKSKIQKATNDIRTAKGVNDWCQSVFKDNAGVIKLDDDWSFVLKVETHNSPSALDPYGGALTGIVGVNRDPFGTGMGSKLLFNTDVFCFGPPNYSEELPKKLMHPTRIFEGVRLGVEHGGNHSGVPTINGAIYFDDCYVGKPLVFCGTGAVMPAEHFDQKGFDKGVKPGDHIVMSGGRIGIDGIHGATFSSVALDDNSPVSAVQIGDPITQKRMFDFLWAAKEENLYRCITDNGAGGLSSSVGEMAEFSNGCSIDLKKAPLKYEGLQPWEIFISESQERMTLAVPTENIDRFLALSKEYQVESTDIGLFNDSGILEATYGDQKVASLPMEFLHDGVPKMKIKAKWRPPMLSEPDFPMPENLGATLKQLLASFNIASKENVIRQYDHEVKGVSVVKPLVGVENDGPAGAGVVRPVLDSMMGVAVANGLCPRYSAIDTYHMTACAIDEGIRNLVAVGADIDYIAGLDNFCWPDPIQSEKTPDGEYKAAQLVRSCDALYDYTTAYGVPCISGKDSMKNDAHLDGKKISIYPTLLFSTCGKIEDIRKCVTMDAKRAGDLVYLLGDTFDECGASEYYHLFNEIGANVPKVNATEAKDRYKKVYQAIQLELLKSCHDCSDGGLGVALAETAFAGGLGMSLNLDEANKVGLRADKFLFSESQSRFVVTVAPEHKAAFENHFDRACYYLGEVTLSKEFQVNLDGKLIIDEDISSMKSAWQSPLQ